MKNPLLKNRFKFSIPIFLFLFLFAQVPCWSQTRSAEKKSKSTKKQTTSSKSTLPKKPAPAGPVKASEPAPTPTQESVKTPVPPPPTPKVIVPDSSPVGFGLSLQGGLTVINEAPADSRIAYGVGLQFPVGWNMTSTLSFHVSKEQQIDLPTVSFFQLDLYSIRNDLTWSFPKDTADGLYLGLIYGIGRVQYNYVTTFEASHTPVVNNIAQINTTFIWGPKFGYVFGFGEHLNLGAETQVILYPEIGALSSFYAIDLYATVHILF